ncbi:hypothetical protein ACFQMB_15140 [Pseudobowmanella zhangzhouensis]|uniref:hypothetical protein n=1 Tax=Pseudobowmanella zhangzhouensis TaxID=1537679 RepID=UPI00361E2D27
MRQRGINVCVLDAVNPAWGCSGRNAGFVLPGTGRLSLAQMIAKWGKTRLRRFMPSSRLALRSQNSTLPGMVLSVTFNVGVT